ncbi:MAG: c-type cytochrome [Hyphomicrobiales bacterium]
MAVSQSSNTYQEKDIEFGEVFVLAIGGKLYDNLWEMTATSAPTKANPAFPKDVNMPASETWRCVTCHGWDYQGSDGERKKTANSPAFTSLSSMVGIAPDMVASKIREKHPEYPGDILEEGLLDILAMFVSIGQYQPTTFMSKDGLAFGDTEAGRAIFEGACMNCHQYDGKATLVGELGDKSSLGWISQNRPEQALHKMLNGVPGTDMLAIRFLTERQIADLLTFLQTLDPKEN